MGKLPVNPKVSCIAQSKVQDLSDSPDFANQTLKVAEFRIIGKPLIIPISKNSCTAELEVFKLSDSPDFTIHTWM